jgi:DNA-binding transcriptional regulator WhiA
MPSNWSKGLTKFSNPSVLKISQTMKLRKIDNFKIWRDRMKAEGKIKSEYPLLKKNADLAELIGAILGDGHIRAYPRTEELSIFSNSNNPGFIARYSKFVGDIFGKKPVISKHSEANCVRIRIYQKYISDRLEIPFSPRANLKIQVPNWILKNKRFIVRYLRGLYEAEGSFCVHKPTSTYKALFANKNRSMLDNVYELVSSLGFHPHWGKYQVQVSRKEEVYKFLELIEFRKY